MSDTQTRFDELTPELQEEYRSDLIEQAKKLGVSFRDNIGTETLYNRVKAARNGETLPDEIEISSEGITNNDNIADKINKVNLIPQSELELSPELKRAKLKEHLETKVRVQITCNDPMKSDWQGEILEVSNNIIGRKKEFVPFNVPWHVNRFILNMLEERTFTHHYRVKTPKGDVNRHKLAKAFNVTLLDPLTKTELEAMSRKQLANKDSEDAYNTL